LIRTERK